MSPWFLAAPLALVLGVTVACGCHTEGDDESIPVVPAAVDEPSASVVQESPSSTEPATSPQTEPTPATVPASPVAKTDPPAAKVDEGPFDANAFPPTLSDSEWHQDAWRQDDCLRCHETGVGEAPPVQHEGMPGVLLTAKCRSCHVMVPGSAPIPSAVPEDSSFAANAFPPMIPASKSHLTTWTKDDCLLCHDSGLGGAPKVKHEGMPAILRTAKCRTCHVQVRAVEATGSGD